MVGQREKDASFTSTKYLLVTTETVESISPTDLD